MKPKKLPYEEFMSIYKKVPRLGVDVILKTDKGVLLTKRVVEPHKGEWHLPGGTVLFGEKLVETTKRVAKEELGIGIKIIKFLGIIEYSIKNESGRHTVTIEHLVQQESGEIRGSDQGEEIGFFKVIPNNMHPEQGKFLTDHKLVHK